MLSRRSLVVAALCALSAAEVHAQVGATIPPECALEGLPRGDVMNGGEPQLQGRQGWLVGFPRSENRDMINWRKRPWRVPTLVQRGPDRWEPNGPSLQHKTPVRVVAQYLGHAGHGSWNGRLEVETADGKRAMVDLRAFTYRPFWACPLRDMKRDSSLWHDYGGHVIAVMAPEVKPTDRDGKWVEVKKNEQLVCETNVIHGEKISGLVILCSVLDARGRDMNTVQPLFSDVTIVY